MPFADFALGSPMRIEHVPTVSPSQKQLEDQILALLQGKSGVYDNPISQESSGAPTFHENSPVLSAIINDHKRDFSSGLQALRIAYGANPYNIPQEKILQMAGATIPNLLNILGPSLNVAGTGGASSGVIQQGNWQAPWTDRFNDFRDIYDKYCDNPYAERYYWNQFDTMHGINMFNKKRPII